MTLSNFPLDTGGEGASISTGNTLASVLSECTGIYAAAAKVYGTYGVTLTITAGSSPAFRFASAATNNQHAFRFCTSGPIGADGGTTAFVPFVTFRHSSGTVCSLRYNKASNLYELVDGSTVLTSFTPASLSTKYEVSLVINNSTGAWSFKVYSSTDHTTVVHSNSGTHTFASSSAFAAIQFGGSSDVTVTQYVDYVQINDGSSSEIAAPSNALPTLTLTANQTKAVGSTVTIDATAADSDGSIASYAFSIAYTNASIMPPLTGASTAHLSFPVGTVGGVLYIVSCTVTDNSGGQDTATTEVRVPTSADTVQPLPGSVSGGAWTPVGSQTDHGLILADGNPGTLLTSPDLSGTASVEPVRLAPMTQRANLTVTVSGAYLTSTITHTSKLRVLCGATQIKEVSLPATTTSSSYTLTLNSSECAGITDWGDVRVAVAAVL